MAQTPLTVFVVSDGTGKTAEGVGRAALVQFPDVAPRLRRFPKVASRTQLIAILDEARHAGAMVVYSLVDAELRREIRRQARELNVMAFDVLGPLIERMRQQLRVDPLGRPGLLRHAEEATLRLGAAIEFTMRHDDGLGLETLGEADLLLLGISRTGKTPTSVYLACNYALRVANIPILPDAGLSEAVLALAVPKVGLTVSPDRLVALRRARIKDLPHYAEVDSIRREVAHGLRLLNALPDTPIVDVTYLAVEEIADELTRALALRRPGEIPDRGS